MTTMMVITVVGGAMRIASHIRLEGVMMTAKHPRVKWVELPHPFLSLLPHQPTITVITIAAVMTMPARMMTAVMGAAMTYVTIIAEEMMTAATMMAEETMTAGMTKRRNRHFRSKPNWKTPRLDQLAILPANIQPTVDLWESALPSRAVVANDDDSRREDDNG
jgi:hypothetical protein